MYTMEPDSQGEYADLIARIKKVETDEEYDMLIQLLSQVKAENSSELQTIRGISTMKPSEARKMYESYLKKWQEATGPGKKEAEGRLRDFLLRHPEAKRYAKK